MLKTRPFIDLILIAVLVIIGSFPENNWAYANGIDDSIRWLFNYIFQSDNYIGTSIVFPHGPLGILIYPLPGNIHFVYAIHSLIKVLLVFQLYYFLPVNHKKLRLLSTLLISFILSLFLGFSHLSLLLILISFYNAIYRKNTWLLTLASILTAASIYISAYQGAIAFLLLFSSSTYLFFIKKDSKMLFYSLLSFILGLLIIHLSLYGTFGNLISYFTGVVNFIQDNSTAVAYYPNNNWFLISISILSLGTLLVLNWRSQIGKLFIFLIFLSFFAAWKHGIAREDTTHYRGFLELISAMLILFFFVQNKKRLVNGTLILIAITCLYLNMFNVENYGMSRYQVWKADNFIDYLMDSNEIEQNARETSLRQIEESYLPKKMREHIGSQTADIYPWEYTIIAANNLNWKGRVVLQSYASYTSWLDLQNANHFKSDQAAEYLVWKIPGKNSLGNRAIYNSIDHRYLLNDEPQTMLSLLENYQLNQVSSPFYLYKKRKVPIELIRQSGDKQDAKLGRWYTVKKDMNSLLRLQVSFDKTIIQKLKSLAYKDEMYWIYLSLKDKRVVRYRIVPKNAKDGLWINPLLIEEGQFVEVEKFKIEASNEAILNPSYSYNWVNYTVENPLFISDFFNAKIDSSSLLLANSIADFEKRELEYWPSLGYDSLVIDSIENNTWHIIRPNSFSSGFVYSSADTIQGELNISAQVKINSKNITSMGEVDLIIEVLDNKDQIKYERIYVGNQILNKDAVNSILINTAVRYSGSNLTIKTYIWNRSENYLPIDDFNVSVLLK